MNREFNYNSYSSLGGVYQSSKNEKNQTTMRMFNSKVENILNDQNLKKNLCKCFL